MLRIRLRREGKKHQPSYRIVVAEARSKRDGKYIESLGFYNPLNPTETTIDQKKYQEWISKGAQPSEKVRKLVLKNGRAN